MPALKRPNRFRARNSREQLLKTIARLRRQLGQTQAVESRCRETEVALAESEARFQGVFSSTGIGIALIDELGRVSVANPSLAAFLGYDQGELRAMTFVALAYAEDRAGVRRLFAQLGDGQLTSFRVHKRFVRKDNSLVWGQLIVSRDSDGLSDQAVAMVQDIPDPTPSVGRPTADDMLGRVLYQPP